MRSLTAILLGIGLIAGACGTSEGETAESDIGTIMIQLDELGPSSSSELKSQSTVIAQATLTSIDEKAGFRGGPNEDEPTSEFVELVSLNFSIDTVFKGTPPTAVAITWDGYVVENLNGAPGDRLARIILSGAEFTSADIGQSFILFLTERDKSLDVITVADGISRLALDGSIKPTTNTGVLKIESEQLTTSQLRE